ncbi:MAG: cytochrome c [Chitinophagia bacterium]|jgi:nitrite reductase (NO-forming)
MKKMTALLCALLFAIIGFSFVQTSATNNSIQDGKKVYDTYCISCHMENGMGVEGAFPSLVKTGNLSDKNRLVKIILQGMRGPLKVNGISFDGEMAGIEMTDKEVADVINYIRNSWGNKAPLVQVAEIPAAKKAVVKGYQPY